MDEVYFLHRQEGDWRLTRYPIYLPDAGALSDLRAAIMSAIFLGPSAGHANMLDWHLEAALRTGTRPYAIHRLATLTQGQPLPEAALQRLAEAFVDAPTPDRSFPPMLALLAPYESSEVDRAATSALKAVPADSWIRDYAAPILAARRDSRSTPLDTGR